MDSIDQQILLQLQHNARVSMTELGKAVNLSQPAVTERVRRLEAGEVITHYKAVVSAEKVWKPIMAYILFHTKDCDRFVEYCNRTPAVLECHRISGEYNYLLKVVVESLRALESFNSESGRHGNSTTLITLSSPIEHKPILSMCSDEQV